MSDSKVDLPSDSTEGHGNHGHSIAALMLAAVGVVYGDIGTSPLYAFKSVFSGSHGLLKPDPDSIYGILSLIIWSITLVVSIKYIAFIMRADNRGEGGILALVSLLRQTETRAKKLKAVLVLAGLFGMALFIGDAVLTPAISVLSAVEGITTVAPALHNLVIPIALVLMVALFTVQRRGTDVVGRFFGPIMITWFTTLGVVGFIKILDHPGVLRSFSPTYAIEFAASNPGITFTALGAVFLAITGAEAIYADMGHFGRKPIMYAWFLIAFPGLALNYLGQGALVLEDSANVKNPFLLLFPDWAQIPAVILATLATLIASQAVITGAFSVTKQAIQLGFLPRLAIRHTSAKSSGQIYVPAVNWALLAAVIAMILLFRQSEKLAAAYGISVALTVMVDSILFLAVARLRWQTGLPLIFLGFITFVLVDLAFVASNMTKLTHGGWMPLTFGAILFSIFMIWSAGRKAVEAVRTRKEGALSDFVAKINNTVPPTPRIAGTAIYLSPGNQTTPLALRATHEHMRAIHEHVVIASVVTHDQPYVPDSDRIVIDDLGHDDGIAHLTINFGYMDSPNVPKALMLTKQKSREIDINPYQASYFLSSIDLKTNGTSGLNPVVKKIFSVLEHNASSPVEYYQLPMENTVSMGANIAI